MFKYNIIVDKISNKIQNNELSSGAKLPSIRQLAEDFNCSKQTVSQALKVLEEQHFIYSKHKSGYYVVDKLFKENKEDNNVFDFKNASPNWADFPYSDFQHCINRAFDIYQKDLFNYNLSNGLSALIKVVQNLLYSSQVFSKEEDIFITSGVQQALNILCLMPLPNENKTILIEEPTYPQIIELLKLYNIPVVTVARKNQKLDIEKIKNIFIEYDIKFFYITSRFQNPLGFSLSKKEKIQLLNLAQKYNVYIVEDDYMADFDSNSKNDPLYTYDSSDKVIYLKSFSKIMFPGLRVGACILPPQLSSIFRHYKINADISSSVFSQAALEIYISSGMYESHIKDIRKNYTEKTKTFVDTVKRHPISKILEYLPPQALKTHIKLPKNINEKKLIDICKQDNVHLIKSDPYYFDIVDNPNHYLLIELSNISNSNIEVGTNLLLDNLEKLFF
ncbi:MAG: PLP-dependent aminotransferase family protein [Peptostreptococcus sp.]|uniref:aminotransferase-like domain-containing protein n=1 Tax=Peptostreptococcus sp. TaxID=1262 RepID=UPI002FCBBEBE